MPIIEFTDKGLFCPAGNFYIDPWKPVDKAIITHAHSDHARWGSKNYLCHNDTKPILQLRLGPNNYESIGWNENIYFNGVRVSLFPQDILSVHRKSELNTMEKFGWLAAIIK